MPSIEIHWTVMLVKWSLVSFRNRLIFVRNATRAEFWLPIKLAQDCDNEKCAFISTKALVLKTHQQFWPCSFHFQQDFGGILCWIWRNQLLFQLCWAIEIILVLLFYQKTSKMCKFSYKTNTSREVTILLSMSVQCITCLITFLYIYGSLSVNISTIIITFNLLIKEEHDVNMRRTLSLHALPVYLCESDSEFFKTWTVSTINIKQYLDWKKLECVQIKGSLVDVMICSFWLMEITSVILELLTCISSLRIEVINTVAASWYCSFYRIWMLQDFHIRKDDTASNDRKIDYYQD